MEEGRKEGVRLLGKYVHVNLRRKKKFGCSNSNFQVKAAFQDHEYSTHITGGTRILHLFECI